MLILMAGLPGTGKSTLAREMSRLTVGHVLNKDLIRDALFGPDNIDYTSEQDDVVVRVMLEAAGFLVQKRPDRNVFLDGRVFSRSSQIEDVIAFSERTGSKWRIIECVCSDETARTRLEADAESGAHVAHNRDFRLYQDVKRRFEPITRPKVVIDTDQPLKCCVAVALKAISN